MISQFALSGVLAASLLAPGLAHAVLVLDTGTPSTNGSSLVLDGNDFYAAEFSLSSVSTINAVSVYLTAGLDSPGDTFTVSIYADPITSRGATADYSLQATYTADGWNTSSTAGLGFVEGPGNYWVAVEVGASDSALGLNLPIAAANGGTAPALAFAFNSGSSYGTAGALPFGVQVDVSPVPMPPNAWLLGSGLFGLGAVVARRRRKGAGTAQA
jgi:hypothetical protein